MRREHWYYNTQILALSISEKLLGRCWITSLKHRLNSRYRYLSYKDIYIFNWPFLQIKRALYKIYMRYWGEGLRRGRGQKTPDQMGTEDRSQDIFLTLPYVNETILCKVKKALKKTKFQVRLGWCAPTSLKKMLVSSDLTKASCPAGSRWCATCEAIRGGRCTDKKFVYEVECKICGDRYIGESKRPVRLRYNPISGRLLATPISGRGLFRTPPPLEISGSYLSIFKIKRHSFHLNMIYISKKRNFQNS